MTRTKGKTPIYLSIIVLIIYDSNYNIALLCVSVRVAISSRMSFRLILETLSDYHDQLSSASINADNDSYIEFGAINHALEESAEGK